MAIVQISRITHRSGLKENLPQLDGSEFGWAIDAQELYIGNGTIAEGAPVIGNTRILTERDDLLSFATSYIYQGDAAGYTVETGPDANEDIERSLQRKLDDFVSVRDFGALGDGVTDDTAAINRALSELYCRDTDTRVRRTLYFPAGTYLVTDTILIPPYARLIGEGADSSVIKYNSDDSSLVDAVARTCGNNLETGTNISTSTITPRFIEINSLSFETTEDTSIFLADRVQHLHFSNVVFRGDKAASDFGGTISEQSALTFDSGAGINTTVKDVVVNHCGFYDCNYGVRVFGDIERMEKVTVTDSEFHSLYSGVEISPSNADSQLWPEGFRIASNSFDRIYARGIHFFRTQYSVSVGNVFFDVGNELNTNNDPFDATFPVVDIAQSNNVSWSDVFKRKENAVADKVAIAEDARIIASESGDRIRLGQLSQESTQDVAIPTDTTTVEVTRIDVTDIDSFVMRYRASIPGTGVKVGSIEVTKDFLGTTPIYNDEHQESGSVRGFTFLVTQEQTIVSSAEIDEVVISLTTTSSGIAGTLRYSLSYFD